MRKKFNILDKIKAKSSIFLRILKEFFSHEIFIPNLKLTVQTSNFHHLNLKFQMDTQGFTT